MHSEDKTGEDSVLCVLRRNVPLLLQCILSECITDVRYHTGQLENRYVQFGNS